MASKEAMKIAEEFVESDAGDNQAALARAIDELRVRDLEGVLLGGAYTDQWMYELLDKRIDEIKSTMGDKR